MTTQRVTPKLACLFAPRLWSAALTALVCLFASPACDHKSDKDIQQFHDETDTPRAGYRDGFRDGHDSAFDHHAGWMWLWTMPPDYQSAYEKGWQEGRNLRRMREAKAKEQKAPF